MKILGIIPARYASTRFPGKPLALIDGRPMIEHVWRGVAGSGIVTRTIVATDDERIADAVRKFGGETAMTSSFHQSGTDRCGEVLEQLGTESDNYDVVINIQGDEPRVDCSQLQLLADCFEESDTEVATLCRRIETVDQLLSPNVVKVVSSLQGKALYFGRSPLPYVRNVEQSQWTKHQKFYKHIGIYAFRPDILRLISHLEPTPLEMSESLEQLRWLENGITIKVRETEVENVSIDTPDDLHKLNNITAK